MLRWRRTPPFYPGDLTPALQHVLALLADLDSYYDEAHRKLERWSGPGAIKQRFSEQLEERRRREREPLVRRLTELEQIRKAAMLKGVRFH